MTLLDNAAKSIRIGVADYLSNDSERIISAVRNIHAGVLLLFKEKLRRLSPEDSDEVLLKQRVAPKIGKDGIVTFKGSGRKTVDLQQIEDRFRTLGLPFDFRPVRDISNHRNDIEHYYTKESAPRLKEVIAESFLIVRDFTAKHLNTTSHALLGEETWQHMLNVATVYQKELEECKAAQLKIDWPSELGGELEDHLACPKCTSELIKPLIPEGAQYFNVDFACCACDEASTYADVIELAIDSRYGAEAHIAIKDGGDPPYEECPECFNDTYLTEVDSCAACGYSRKHYKCLVCHTSLSVGEQQFRGLCSYHAWQANKDD